MDAKEIREEFYGNIFPDLARICQLRPALWPVSYYQERFKDLQKLGFSNPKKMIVSFPSLLSYSIMNIDQKIKDLRSLGFKNPIKIITSCPSLFGSSLSNLKVKIAELEKLGFKNPIKIITSFPPTLLLATENVAQKIEDLQALGFANPQKLINSLPAILGLSVQNIKSKIDNLSALGFVNPNQMIISLPALLSYSVDSIKIKLSFYCRVLKGSAVNYLEIAERYPISLGFAQARISLVMRILYDQKIPLTGAKLFARLSDPQRYVAAEDLIKYPKLKRLYQLYYDK
ncbi:MAG TPA: hypothetical protein PKI61_02360 [bacterium]|nr:hypothetical protein [bacterium]HPT29991.1 hypothetical protein [bacterium]